MGLFYLIDIEKTFEEINIENAKTYVDVVYLDDCAFILPGRMHW